MIFFAIKASLVTKIVTLRSTKNEESPEIGKTVSTAKRSGH